MLGDNINEGLLFNQWNSENNINTFRSYIAKYPLLNDGANTGGTGVIVTGTSGTLQGTFSFNPQSKWCYVLQGLGFNLTQNGTFGTLILNDVKLNGVTLGTTGTIADFATKYGEDLTLISNINFEYTVNCGTGIVGTFAIDCEVSGWKFKTIL